MSDETRRAARSDRTGAEYDLIVVGGGVAGLSSAYFWLTQVDPNARVLVLERSLRWGGHAVRHRFEVDGRVLLSPGGSQDLTFPSSFAPPVTSALAHLGVDLEEFHTNTAPGHYAGLGAGATGIAFPAQVWGRSHLATVDRRGRTTGLERAPVSARARTQITALFEDPTDWLAGRNSQDVLAQLRTRSCEQLLRAPGSLDEDVFRFLRYSTSAQSGMTFDQHPALDAALVGYLGLDGLELPKDDRPWAGLTRTGAQFFPHRDPPIFRYPDGNATVARALAHHLVPDLFSAMGVADRLTADPDTTTLDRPGAQVRIQVGATVTGVEHDGPAAVLVHSDRAGTGRQTHRARAVIVATPAVVAARLVAELTPDQHAAAAGTDRFPIVSASIVVRDWRAWRAAGVCRLMWPGHDTWQVASLEFPVTLGAAAPPRSPDEPTTLTALGALTAAGMPAAAGARTGRRRLAATPRRLLADQLCDLLAQALQPAGLDPRRDIVEVRVETWRDGYARCATSRDVNGDGSATTGAKRRLARGVGRVAIAGVDVIDHPFLDGAMESAHAAVINLAAR